MNRPSASTPADTTAPRRVRAIVALRLLEVMRDQDLPGEVLESEDPTQTMPRRLGLSDVVERQIRSYKDDVKRGMKLTDAEIIDLFRLVIRRPDGEEIFERAGRVLAGDLALRWKRAAPKRMAFWWARGRVRRRLKWLFGRRLGGFGRGPFFLEGRSLLFMDADPGGDACFFMSGLCAATLEQVVGSQVRVEHTRCQARRDEQCRWEGELVGGPESTASELAPSTEAS